ncbi:MAG: hypothetical protein E6I37_03600 [Chloroflexi bacterium]|nr:MAG: hypothetical protein E6I37_03600 [Chloroflexota bacterium]
MAVLPGGRARYLLARRLEESAKWTEEYRQYFEDASNGRGFPFKERGSFDPELTRPLYKVWALEKAGLHPTGHDDRGEIRTDGASALSLPLFAATSIEEVVEWLIRVFDRLDRIVAPALPAALAIEKAALASWPERLREAQSAARDPTLLRTDGRGGAVDDVSRWLERERLFLMFPRDRRGRLWPRARVLLAPAGPGADTGRRPWVVAIGPERAGGRTLTIRIEPVIAVNEAHRFDLAPWLWRRDAPPLAKSSSWAPLASDGAAILLLARGKIEEGLRTSGLTLDEAVTRLARGQVLGLGYEDPSWPAVARESLSLIFPALLLSAGFRYASRILRRPHDGLRLFTLPGQRQARKASIMFVPGDTPRLELAWMGSNRRLSYLLWQRPAIPGVL